MLIVFNSVSGNNQIGFDLPVDNLKTGKVRNTFPTTYGELDIFQVSLPHFTRGASWKYFFTRGRVVLIPFICPCAVLYDKSCFHFLSHILCVEHDNF